MLQSDLLSERMTSACDDYECPRDHAGMEGGILMLQLADIRAPICLRCLANMLRCCEAVPKQKEPLPDDEQAQGEDAGAKGG